MHLRESVFFLNKDQAKLPNHEKKVDPETGKNQQMCRQDIRGNEKLRNPGKQTLGQTRKQTRVTKCLAVADTRTWHTIALQNACKSEGH